MANYTYTKRDLFNFVASLGTETPIEFDPAMAVDALAFVAKMDERNEKAKAKSAEKRANAPESNVGATNAKICEDALAVLDGQMTGEELLTAMGGEDYVYTKADGSDAPLTTQKLSNAIAVAVKDGRIVKDTKLVGNKAKVSYAKA